MTEHKTIATHNGSFHADDVYGVGVLMGVFPSHTLVRTRNQAQIESADFAVDVGGLWDKATGRFDHHQRGFAGARPVRMVDGLEVPGVGYASAGLVWAVYGDAYVNAVAKGLGVTMDAQALAETSRSIDASLVQYLDIVDTGQGDVAPGIFGLSALVAQLNTNWMEELGLSPVAKAESAGHALYRGGGHCPHIFGPGHRQEDWAIALHGHRASVASPAGWPSAALARGWHALDACGGERNARGAVRDLP